MTQRMWDVEHVDYVERLMQQNSDYTAQELATLMAKKYRRRVTPSQINLLLQRMRKPGDPFFRNLPYRRRGVRRG